jgi:hypothetical protein
MSRSDKIDVMTAGPLELQHHPGQSFERDFPAFAQMADGVVLAEKATEVAVGEKNCP